MSAGSPWTGRIRETTRDVNWAALTADLEADHFSNGRTPEELRRSFENSACVAFAWEDDRIVGKARALSDGVCNAYVVDVWTRSDRRRKGIASRLVQSLLDRLEGQHVYLFTEERQTFYRALGFVEQPTGMGRVVGSWLRREPPA